MLFEPTLSPFDAVKFNLTGSIKVTGCVSLLDPLSARNESGFKPGVNPPPGIPRGVATPGRMGWVMEFANRGTFYFERCGNQGDKVLVFYLPPPGLFAVPGAGPFNVTTSILMSAALENLPNIAQVSSLPSTRTRSKRNVRAGLLQLRRTWLSSGA